MSLAESRHRLEFDYGYNVQRRLRLKEGQSVRLLGLQDVAHHSLKVFDYADEWDALYASNDKQSEKIAGVSLKKMILFSFAFIVVMFVAAVLYSPILMVPAIGVAIVLMSAISISEVREWLG